jgi:CubicO group peptidase (beta-lactamase class C family)
MIRRLEKEQTMRLIACINAAGPHPRGRGVSSARKRAGLAPPEQGADPSFGALLALALLLPATALAQPESRGDVEAFFDGVIAAHMRSYPIASATVSLVKEGDLFFEKGYGYADRESRRPVDPEKTLFRPGSISKLFTWTAVMQLVERGQIDLDADVNTYLNDLRIPDTWPEPITMRHLMTHTPGFEDGALGYLLIKDESQLVPLSESLRAHVPWRVRPPGTYSSYSNYGTALAGLIVANVSGMPFEEYVERNIFEPLGMANSTFREPLPARLAGDMATAYQRRNGAFERGHFELISNFGPAGALSSTAADMAKFMIAHLRFGRYGENRILTEETARRMQERIYFLDERLPGMLHGFYEDRVRGQRIIGHGGDTQFFHSTLALFPEHDLGFFVSLVGENGLSLLELTDAFVARYFPEAERLNPAPTPEAAARAARFAGSYRFTRQNWSTIEKLLALFQSLSVAATEKGELVVQGFLPDPMRFVEVEPLLFRQVDGTHEIAFREDGSGAVTHMFFDFLPFMPTYRVAWFETQGFTLTVVAAALLLSLTAISGGIRHRWQNWNEGPSGLWTARVAALMGLLTLAFLGSAFAIVASTGEELFYGIPGSLTAALFLPHLTAVLLLVLAALLWIVFRRRVFPWRRRIHYALFFAASLALHWIYWHWNVLGFRY